jgi:hypothetical protein
MHLKKLFFNSKILTLFQLSLETGVPSSVNKTLPYRKKFNLTQSVNVCLNAGVWGIGIATKRCDLNKIPLGNSTDSWVLRSEGTVAHNSLIRHNLTVIPEEGDIIVS